MNFFWGRMSAPIISGLTVATCCALWVALGYVRFEHDVSSGLVSLGFAYLAVLAVYVIGCLLVGYFADSQQVLWVLGSGLVVAVFVEVSYDGMGQPLANYLAGIFGNLVIFLAPGVGALVVGLILGRRRRLPDPPQ